VKSTVICLFLFLNVSLLCQNTEAYFYSLSISNGLPSNTIYTILQSKEGAVYIAHENGLTRYNGKTFKHYTYFGKGKSISNLVEDANGRIWARTFYGDVLYLENDSIIRHPLSNFEKNGLLTLKILNKNLYAFDIYNLYLINNHKTSTVNFHLKKDNNSIRLFDIYASSNYETELCIQTNTCIVIRNIKNQELNDNTISKTINQGAFNFITLNKKQYLYSSGTNTFFEKNGKQWTTSICKLKFDHSYAKLTGITTLFDSLFCVFGYDGVLLFNENGDLKEHLFKGSQISSVTNDKEGNIWVGTLHEGVFIIPSLNIRALNLELNLGKKDYISSIIDNSTDEIILGTYNGKLFWLNTKGNFIDSLKLNKTTEAQSMYLDKRTKKLYVFCDGVYRINNTTKKIENYLSANSTKDIFVKGDSIFCASSSGFFLLHNNQRTYILKNNWINNLLIDTVKQCIWLATKNGLYNYSIKNGLCSFIKIKEFENCILKSLQKDIQNNLYILAFNKGVYKRSNDGVITLITNNREIEKIKLIQDSLFLVSKDGIIVYSTKTLKQCYSLNSTNGLSNDNILNFFKLNGNYFKVSPTSIQCFNKWMPLNKVYPTVLIKSISGSFKQKDSIYKSFYSKNNLEFTIEVLPNIRDKGHSKIKYILKGIDENWIVKENNLEDFTFKYQLLPPGNYRFEVIATNGDNVSSKPLILKLIVLPPFWKTTWFIGLLIILIFLLFLIFYKWRIGIIKKSNLKKIEKERAKIHLLSAELTAIRSQMNPHFIFNSLSSIQSKVLSEDRTGAYKDIATFSKLMRSVLNHSSKEFIKLSEEIDFLKDYLYLESVRVDGKINYQLNIDESLDINFIEIPTLITQPFVENAIKHGLLHKTGDKNLIITISKQNQGLSISILDNGVGREKSLEINKRTNPQHKSFASDAIIKRIKHINESNKMLIDLKIIDHLQGTEVLLKITY
jgi:ligand-binding sensor domain-containing protein